MGMVGDAGKIKVALAHDWLVGMRGGERVLDRLAQCFGPTELYTLVDDGRFLSDAIADCRIVTSPLQRFPGAPGRLRRVYLPFMPWAVERIKVEPCDVLISTSSAVMKSIRPPAGAKHICYCHSPARYLWDQLGEYGLGSGGRVRSLGLRMMRRRFQRWDRATADRVDVFLANSSHTAARIMECYGREAVVVPPPVRTTLFTPDETVPREDWYLVVAALEPYKRTDLAIAAANRAGVKLKVAGTGSQLRALQAMAGANVELLGRVGDDELLALYRRAKALIFPQMEDFGIVAVEAQATGCPVIAYGRGGALDSVPPETGVRFETQSVDSMIEALEELNVKLQDKTITVEACRANVERFSEDTFDDAIIREVNRVIQEGMR